MTSSPSRIQAKAIEKAIQSFLRGTGYGKLEGEELIQQANFWAAVFNSGLQLPFG
jgi:hypothetical protein